MAPSLRLCLPTGTCRQYLCTLPIASSEQLQMQPSFSWLAYSCSGLLHKRRRCHLHLCGRAHADRQPQLVLRVHPYLIPRTRQCYSSIPLLKSCPSSPWLCGPICGSSGAILLISSSMSTLKEPQTTSSPPSQNAKRADCRHPLSNQFKYM